MTEIYLLVTKVRSRGMFGGVIVSGQEIKTKASYAAVFNYEQIPDSSGVNPGQVWRLEGTISQKTQTNQRGYQYIEKTITVEKSSLQAPSGESIIAFLSSNPKVVGIGEVKARRLYLTFGIELLDIIHQKDIVKLQAIDGISEESAKSIVRAFEEFDCAKTLIFLDSLGVSRSIGMKILKTYGVEAYQRIRGNPYRLLSFCAKWEAVDAFAMDTLEIAPNSKIRLQAAIEQALYNCFDSGSTAVAVGEIKNKIKGLLGSAALANDALCIVDSNGQYFRSESLYHPVGAWIMERYIAERAFGLIKGKGSAQHKRVDDTCDLEKVMSDFENREGICLNAAQREAVLRSATNNFSLILGGAGVGKTTVLKCVYEAIKARQTFCSLYQVALSGKAAKRMSEATDMESFTIAGFLKRVPTKNIAPQSWIAIDEASMVDVITMYKLLRHIPETCRIILIGDPYQLPPVGSGLILHAFANADVPKTTLIEVRRQSEASGIPQVAASIRRGIWPSLPRYEVKTEVGVSFFPCMDKELSSCSVDRYLELSGSMANQDVQILCATRTGLGGVEALNLDLQGRLTKGQPCIGYMNVEFGKLNYLSKAGYFRVGDLVIYTKNDYDAGLRNGSLGKIIERLNPENPGDPLCIVDFEGSIIEITADRLINLELSYAITVHKSQGSQFKHVIIPIRKTRLLDLTLLYTAVTRAVEQVVLIGDESVAKEALKTINANKRSIGLPLFLNRKNLDSGLGTVN
jgi:exodeoxyribonuclease V alpha subunit